jgi:hypothetical protein
MGEVGFILKEHIENPTWKQDALELTCHFEQPWKISTQEA